VLDSLSAFSSDPLSRDEIYRLFTLFKSYGVTAIVTLENYSGIGTDRLDAVSLVSAKYLADVVIKLSRKSTFNFTINYLAIEKSRQGRQNIGEHLYKIHTKDFVRNLEIDRRCGIVVYPSLSNTIVEGPGPSKEASQESPQWGVSKASPKGSSTRQRGKIAICGQGQTLYQVIQHEHINEGDCFAIVGPEGTHKLALAMNIGLASKIPGGENSLMLIITFGNTGVTNFSGIAWVDELKAFVDFTHEEETTNHPRYSIKKILGTRGKDGTVSLKGHIITFKTGYLTPEECFYIIQERIKKTEEEGAIGNRDLNFALLSKADYRFFLTHYPSMSELAKILLQPVAERELNITEQSVCLIIDNVSGKHYGRSPIWIKVDVEGVMKTLICENTSAPARGAS
jgi:hypothetical protein